MKKVLFLAAAALTFFACGKGNESNPDKPSVKWQDGAYQDTREYSATMDAVLSITVPGGVDLLTITLPAAPSGNPDYVPVLARPHIGVSANRGSAPVFDLIDDAKAAQDLLAAKVVNKAGSGLRGTKTEITVNLLQLFNLLTENQEVENNDNVQFVIKAADASGNEVSKTAKIHYTAKPSFSWANNTPASVLELSEYAKYSEVKVEAPGKIATVMLKLNTESAALVSWLDGKRVKTLGTKDAQGYYTIDLLNDELAPSKLKIVDTSVKGKTSATLNFTELLENMETEISAEASSQGKVNFLKVIVSDELEKENELEMKFRYTAVTQ